MGARGGMICGSGAGQSRGSSCAVHGACSAQQDGACVVWACSYTAINRDGCLLCLAFCMLVASAYTSPGPDTQRTPLTSRAHTSVTDDADLTSCSCPCCAVMWGRRLAAPAAARLERAAWLVHAGEGRVGREGGVGGGPVLGGCTGGEGWAMGIGAGQGGKEGRGAATR